MDSTSSEIILVLGIILLALLCAAAYLVYAFVTKENTIQAMKTEHTNLMRSFDELDEQAKLIIRTDLELTKTREEMNKRLGALNALQRTSRQMSQALNEEEIFQRISPALFDDMGFNRTLIASLSDTHGLKVRLNEGFQEQRLAKILTEMGSGEFQTLAQSVTSTSCSAKLKEKMLQIFECEHFILAPIVTQTGNIGFIFVGNRLSVPDITQGEEELITILAGQIGQCIENARLFEKVFRSSQELELKVADRTKQLAAAFQKVNEISKKKTEFISAVSHELRTPLTSIKGYAAILIAGKIGEVPPAVKERLAKINSHSDNLVGLINDLLDIARIESGRQEMKFAAYKIKNIVENVVDLLTPQINAKGVKVHMAVPDSVKEVFVDISQTERVFINLINNAIKFTPAQGSITVAVAPMLEQGFAVFSIADTGIGIPASELQKLFSEFFRVDNEINQNIKGTGLGLVLAQNIVQAHRGRIWVESKPGTGTTFYFTLPSTQLAYEEQLKLEKTTHAP